MSAGGLASLAFLFPALVASVEGRETQDSPRATIQVGPEVHVTRGFENEIFWEPHIVALPGESPRFVVASFIVQSPPGPGLRSKCVTFRSIDGGASWARSPDGTFDESRICVDPWLAADLEETVYLTYLHSFEETESSFRLGVRIVRSVDSGNDWSVPVSLPLDGARGYDKPSIVVDSGAKSPRLGRVYVHAAAATRNDFGERVSWIAAAQSSNRAVSFTAPIRIGETRLTLNSCNPTVLSDGTLLVPFNEVGTGGGHLLESPRLWVARSTDGGSSFSLPYLVTEIAEAFPYVLAASPSRAFIAFKGREGASHIYVVRSEDQGRTWSEPARVNDNSSPEAFHLVPMMALNQSGTLLVAWYDRRSDPENRCTEVYASASLDGGVSFLPNARVSGERSCPPDDDRGAEMQKWNVGGEYAGVASAGDGSFQIIWSDARSGTFQLYTARLFVR